MTSVLHFPTEMNKKYLFPHTFHQHSVLLNFSWSLAIWYLFGAFYICSLISSPVSCLLCCWFFSCWLVWVGLFSPNVPSQQPGTTSDSTLPFWQPGLEEKALVLLLPPTSCVTFTNSNALESVSHTPKGEDVISLTAGLLDRWDNQWKSVL